MNIVKLQDEKTQYTKLSSNSIYQQGIILTEKPRDQFHLQ
jgi:hypothetical protein